MNAIILAGGKSSRMYATGATVHKALLPIMGIPNIERTIMMLHDFHIVDIIIAVPAFNHDFDYLIEKYSCIIEHIPLEGKNTLYTMKYLLHYVQETFVIEGDVVCAQNIFRHLNSSCYYVMNYAITECDAWHPILNSDGEVESFEIGNQHTLALFGVSYWTGLSSAILKEHIASISTFENLNNSNIFWDDFIQEILPNIKVKTVEILQEEACEMNTYEEYELAQHICTTYLNNCQNYFERIHLMQISNNQRQQVHFVLDRYHCLRWQEQLLKHYDKKAFIKRNSEVFGDNELPFIIKDNQNNEYGFFSIAEENDFILLRRLFIDKKYRNNGLGSKVVQFTLTYARLKSKELRVNVYDQKAEAFYTKIGFVKKYICYHIH